MGAFAENHRWKNACAFALFLAKSGRTNLPPFRHRSHRLGDVRISLVNVWWNAARVQQGRIRVGSHDMQWVRDEAKKRASDRPARSWIECISSIANWPT
jgi:hypothetical protein